MLEVVTPGLLDTVQDAGRPNAVDLGVPAGGACDPLSMGVANLIHRNPAGAPVVEITLEGPVLAVRETCTLGLAGADLGAIVREEGRPLATGLVHQLWAGTTVAFGAPVGDGCRAYLSLAGGVDEPFVLGSASTCLVGGFGGIDGRPLRSGDVLRPVRRDDMSAAGAAWHADGGPVLGWPDQPQPGGLIRVVPGPHAEGLGAAALEALTGVEWRVEPESNRMGLRLSPSGPDLSGQLGQGSDDLLSFGVIWGAIQLPPDGRPIVLLADHQTVGGYPVLASVTSADRPAIGQLAPGAAVRFAVVSIDEAQRLYREQQAKMRAAIAELARTSTWDEAWREARG
jgi:biotin-dependent carboxylase-like uncharacterized protein